MTPEAFDNYCSKWVHGCYDSRVQYFPVVNNTCIDGIIISYSCFQLIILIIRFLPSNHLFKLNISLA